MRADSSKPVDAQASGNQAVNVIPELKVSNYYYFYVKPEDCVLFIGGTSGDPKWILSVRGREHVIGYSRRDFVADELQKREIKRIDGELERLRSLLRGNGLIPSDDTPSTATSNKPPKPTPREDV